MQVTINDNGYPSRSANAYVIIHILDENDNAPVFIEKTYASINIPARDRTDDRQVIYRAVAKDDDIGENAELSYYILEGNEDGKFEIEPTTGIIATTKLLQEEELYNLVVGTSCIKSPVS